MPDFNPAAYLAAKAVNISKSTTERSGQALFNDLPEGAADAVAGTMWDPFHKELSYFELLEWIENHLILEGTIVIGVFNGDDILWEEGLCSAKS